VPYPIRTPRVNNNDDTVRLSAIVAEPGARLQPGDLVAEVETDKATFAVEADRPGYFLRCLHAVGDTLDVGSVLAWMGDAADESVPGTTVPGAAAGAGGSTGGHAAEPTLRAALLLREYGVAAADVTASGDRLSVADVEAHVRALGLQRRQAQPPTGAAAGEGVRRTSVAIPPVASTVEDLTVTERGMLRTVSWHRDEAVTGYVEIAYDPAPWEAYGASFQQEHKLLLNPMLSLMAFQLVALRARNAKYNATVVGERKVLYEPVNVGFTVQGGDNLYLTVVSGAEAMTAKEFVARLLELQKAAMRHRLEGSETSGATIGFTSMARWGVMRHQPVLPPYTSLMVAHAASANGVAALGATYDHRLLSGADVVAALRFLAEPA